MEVRLGVRKDWDEEWYKYILEAVNRASIICALKENTTGI